MAPINKSSRAARPGQESAYGNSRDVFERDDEMDAFFGNVNGSPSATAGQSQEGRAKSRKDGAEQSSPLVNIDEEVKVRMRREPAPKLDEERLLSAKGIPKLRKISKDRLKFKGKGHEYSDMAKLLKTYQFWLDDLYPRAKFLDALSMVEKVGHTRRLTVMRKEWIDEGKPRLGSVGNDEDVPSPDKATSPEVPQDLTLDQDDITQEDMDALMAESTTSASRTSLFGEGRPATATAQEGPSSGEIPDEEEMDALMRESESTSVPAHNVSKESAAATAAPPDRPREDTFFDEYDDMW